MNLFFIDSNGEERLLGTYNNSKDAFCKINEFLNEHNYKSYYKRMYINNDNHTIIDVGSHTEFFKVDCDLIKENSTN